MHPFPRAAKQALILGALPTLFLGLPSAFAAQEAPTPDPSFGVDLEASLGELRTRTAAPWRIRRDSETGYADFVYGATLAPSFQPQGDAEFAELARGYLAEAYQVMGIDPASLGEPTVTILPPSLGGGMDKVAVSFEQAVRGVPVTRGHVNILMSSGGALLALDSRGLPELSDLDTRPRISSLVARATASTAFVGQTGVVPTEFSEPKLVIDQALFGKQRRATLAWEYELRAVDESNGIELGRRYSIAADGTPRVLRNEDLIHFFDVGGQVVTNATPGTLPDIPANPETQQPAAYMRVTSNAGTTFTDTDGNFNFPGVTGPLDVSFEFEGLYNDVANDQGAQHTITQSLTGTGNTVLMNPGSNGQVTSQANVFVGLNTMRDWIREINPDDGMMDFVNTSEVNENFVDFGGGFVISGCNAFFNGFETVYFLPQASCPNTAYSSVVAHEQGHWLNERYSSGNGPDGFGEGNADVFAMYLYDTPIVGEAFTGGGFIRTGENTVPYCGDGNGGCHGETHLDGQVLMGAMWKMRRNLKNKHGAEIGGLIADQLFNSWMNAFDQGQIDSVIETQLVTLDDDDGNISNGSPNFAEIDAAFREQGFPGLEVDLIELQNLVAIENTLDEAGPYGVAIDVNSLVGETITQVVVRYDAGSGEQVLALQKFEEETYSALLPGVPSPAEVSYVIEATDSAGNLQVFPSDGPLVFRVGEFDLHFADDFEGPTDNGWVHEELATQDDWQRGTPGGSTGFAAGVAWADPSVAASGNQIWGNDLGPVGFNGAYQPNVINLLRSPSLDLSQANGARLRFQRWLTVEEGSSDQAQIRVNGGVEWENPMNQNLVDTEWSTFELDLSAFDGVSDAELEFRLETDATGNFGGWNIDDLSVFSLAPSPTADVPVAFGSGFAGQFGEPVLDSLGQPAVIGNSDFLLAIKDGVPNGEAILAVGTQSANIPLAAGQLLVVPELLVNLSLDLFGQGQVPVPLANNPSLVGVELFMQGFVVDSTIPFGFASTRGLSTTFGG